MRRLIWGFAGRTYHIVWNLMHWLSHRLNCVEYIRMCIAFHHVRNNFFNQTIHILGNFQINMCASEFVPIHFFINYLLYHLILANQLLYFITWNVNVSAQRNYLQVLRVINTFSQNIWTIRKLRALLHNSDHEHTIRLAQRKPEMWE